MTLDINLIRQSYSNFEDFKIEHIAKYEATGLAPEVLEILILEIQNRKLNLDLIKGIEAQTKKITENDVIEIKDKIVNLECPECGQNDTPLVGTIIHKVFSFIIFTSSREYPIITCEACAAKKRKDAFIFTAILGWWGVPFGIFRTPIALVRTYKDYVNRKVISDAIISRFSIENIGEIKTNWEEKEKLVDFLRQENRNN